MGGFTTLGRGLRLTIRFRDIRGESPNRCAQWLIHLAMLTKPPPGVDSILHYNEENPDRYSTWLFVTCLGPVAEYLLRIAPSINGEVERGLQPCNGVCLHPYTQKHMEKRHYYH
jgi:hypothetical protein